MLQSCDIKLVNARSNLQFRKSNENLESQINIIQSACASDEEIFSLELKVAKQRIEKGCDVIDYCT